MCECVPDMVDGHEWNRFVGRNLHECIYTPLDYTAFFVGWTSLVFWFCCQIPQFYKNYKNKSAAALSIIFLAEWFAGDLLNLVSSILTGQLTTQIATATLFVCMDLCLCSQWIYYTKIYKRKNSKNIDNDDDDDDVENMYHFVDENKDDRDGNDVSSFAIFTPLLVFGGLFFTTTTTIMIPYNNNSNNEIHGTMRHLMTTKECDATAIGNHTTKVIGVVLAYCSATVYLTSRLPQILKNYTRKSVAGLSPYMFMCAVMGNLTYALGVLIKKPTESELIDALPFLIGSLGTICFDLVILMQHIYYEYYFNKATNRPTYLMRFDTTARQNLPHGIHNIVDPMASPFFPPNAKGRMLCSDVSPSNFNADHRRGSE